MTKPIQQQKPFWILLALLIIACFIFWTGSRYPALDEKALMGSDTQIEAIGFDILISISDQSSTFLQVLVNSINWMYTNWRGMAFGLIAGTLLLSILPYLQRFQFKNRIANSITGIIIGAPLGVCVNCATPIAQGIFRAGNRSETALAALISSPTLNIIVLTMSFSLLPAYLAIAKVGFTIAVILLVVPFIAQLFKLQPEQTIPQQPSFTIFNKSAKSDTLAAQNLNTDYPAATGWLASLVYVLQQLLKNGLFIIRTTIPLMILAGILGATLITLIPLESLVDTLPSDRLKHMLIFMLCIALFGLFLPVPIAFDIIVTSILLHAGMPATYAMVFLFTLGIFSIYPYMLLFRISKFGATLLYLCLTIAAVLSGIAANRYEIWHQQNQQNIIKQSFVASKVTEKSAVIDRISKSTDNRNLVQQLTQQARQQVLFYQGQGISIYQSPFSAKAHSSSDTLFSRENLSELGITETDNFSIHKLLDRYARSRGIASGDIHNDNRPDVIIASESGFGLYANIAGEGFVQQPVPIAKLAQWYISTVALIDLNNDGWKDIVFSAFEQGVFVIYNHQGEFLPSNMSALYQDNSFISTALSFGDLDRNGELDIHIGNAHVGNTMKQASYQASANYLLYQHNGKFTLQSDNSIPGETLSGLVTDIDQDHWPDLIIGNEFEVSDVFYRNDQSGQLSAISQSENMLTNTARTTMSIDSADIDNDLIPELYIAQRSWDSNPDILDNATICAEIFAKKERQHCLDMLTLRNARALARQRNDLAYCQTLEDEYLRQSCIALQILHRSNPHISKDTAQCSLLQSRWPKLYSYCIRQFDEVANPSATALQAQIPQIKMQNILLQYQDSGRYENIATAYGVAIGGWSWNAKFADLDNDGWQDLFIATGDITVRSRHPQYVFRNIQGSHFENITAMSGLQSMRDFLSYTYIDNDADGDMDIIALPAAGSAEYYRNNSQHQSIIFELHDQLGNRTGIGSRIHIFYDNGQQSREIKASGGFLSFDAPQAHFGLGDISAIEKIEIVWSTGDTSIIKHPFLAGNTYRIYR